MQEKIDSINIKNFEIPIYSFQTIIIGTGCAAFNAADTLFDLGIKDIAIVTEGVNMGTSRNTGSDKQTYYKLSLASKTKDSVYEMAETLYDGQCIHGDIALIESVLSTRCFYKLVNLGVPFPHDIYGQYVGYKTDHDPKQRATSSGPLTSKYMTQCLEKSVNNKNITIFDGYRIIRLLTNDKKEIIGALSIRDNNGSLEFSLFRCTNIIYATGGPSGIYYRSVYPETQTCGHGAAFMCGAKGVNVTEWQYGIASTKFRWNLSGSSQQVIPIYVSTDSDGNDEKYFLHEYFETKTDMLSAIFMKGYQWPFDPRKLEKGGSSIIDIAIYIETKTKGRRVFLDYRTNPSEFFKDGKLDFSLLNKEAYEYLEKSNVLFGTPIERLLKMNRPAYELYKNNNIDLLNEKLEIAVCSQHNNGGLQTDIWWQSNIKGLFPVGEVSGNFGVYRPGGTALNSSQVSSLRAAQYISKRATNSPINFKEFLACTESEINRVLEICENLSSENKEKLNAKDIRIKYQKEMDEAASYIRDADKIYNQIKRCKQYLSEFDTKTYAKKPKDMIDAFINQDILITQLVYLSAMKEYIDDNGNSRGSYLISRGDIDFSNARTLGIVSPMDNGMKSEIIQETELKGDKVIIENIKRRAIPNDDSWFEVVYNEYLNDNIIK